MALTVTTPSNSVASRPVLWKFESDTVNIVRCILEIYADGGTEPVSTIELNPDRGTTDEFTFDISSVLIDYVSFSLADPDVTDVTTTTLSQSTGFFGYFVRAYEVEDNGTTGYPSTPDYTSSDFTAYNMAFTHFEWVAPFNIGEYNTVSGSNKKFLTNAPDPKCVYRGELEFVAGLKALYSGTTFKRDYYNSSDVLLLSESFNIGGSGVTPTTAEMNYGKIKTEIPGGTSLNIEQLTSTITAGNEYGLPVDGGNGFMYCLPLNETNILKINKTTGAITTITGGYSWPIGLKVQTSVLAPNGKIYGVPFSDDLIFVLDVGTETISTLNVPTTTGNFSGKWRSCVINSSGVVYAVPNGGAIAVNTVLKIDTNTDVVTEFGSINPGVGIKYVSCGIGSNDIIYAFSNTPVRPILKIDTFTDSISTFGSVNNNRFIASRCYEYNGFMYAFATNNFLGGAYDIIKINISTDAVSYIPLGTSSNTHQEAVLASDNKFYIIPSNGGNLLEFDPVTENITDLGLIEASPEWDFAAAADNFIFGIPINGLVNPEVLKITLSAATVDPDYALVYFEDSGNNPITEKRRYNFKDKCGTGFRVHWQNPYGAQDSYTFEGLYEKGYKHGSKTYQQPLGISFIDEDRGLSVFSSELSEEFTIFSKGIGRDTIEWLSEMLRSKRAWIEINNRFYPIIINNGTFKPENSEETIFQFVISGMLANKSKGQKA